MSAAEHVSSDYLENYFSQSLADRDPELFSCMQDELKRQQDEIELIASENIVSHAVMEAQGSVVRFREPVGQGRAAVCIGAARHATASAAAARADWCTRRQPCTAEPAVGELAAVEGGE